MKWTSASWNGYPLMFSHVDLCEFSILFYDVYRPGSIGLRLYSTFKKVAKSQRFPAIGQEFWLNRPQY